MSDIPEPISDNDKLLHNIIDGTPDITDMVPTSREEEYLKYIALNGAGGSGGVGKDLSGQMVNLNPETTVIAGTGAEIFNDYRDITFDDNGRISAGNVASGEYSHAEGTLTTASGKNSHAEGTLTTASGKNSHAEGRYTIASGEYSHSEGMGTIASGKLAHAEGYYTAADGKCSHSEGYYCVSGEEESHAEGYNSKARGKYSHAGGSGSISELNCSFAHGYMANSKGYQAVFGKFNRIINGATSETTQDNTAFLIGNGTSSTSLDLAFRVDYNGDVYSDGNHSTGSGFAEYFEWEDGNKYNEDRRGLFVTLNGDKIVLADEYSSYILGIITGTPTIVGNSADNRWNNMYLKDIFGQRITEQYEEEVTDSNGETSIVKGTRFVINPEYDHTLEYISRKDRSEWSYVSLLGQEVAVDDGSCTVNGYCSPGYNGKATKSSKGYRVIKRIDENHIKIIIQ